MRSAATCRRLRGCLSFRPHVLTLIALSFAAALIALANLSDDLGLRRPATLETGHELTFDVQDVGAWHPRRGYYWNLSYGWPLLWRQAGPLTRFPSKNRLKISRASPLRRLRPFFGTPHPPFQASFLREIET